MRIMPNKIELPFTVCKMQVYSVNFMHLNELELLDVNHSIPKYFK